MLAISIKSIRDWMRETQKVSQNISLRLKKRTVPEGIKDLESVREERKIKLRF